MTPIEIAGTLETTANNIKQLLHKMAKSGDVYRVRNGRYRLEPLHPHNSDNRSNPDDGGDDE